MRRSIVGHVVRLVTVATAVAALTAGATTAGATGGGGGGRKSPTVIADGLVGPLHLDALQDGGALVSQSFAGTISLVSKRGVVTDLVTEPGGFTGGVAAGPFGTILYLVGNEAGTFLKVRLPDGTVRTLADLGTYEATKNPDQGNQYGFQGLDQTCIDQLPDIPGIAPYSGDVNSNPYELVLTPFGALVADAGGNDILLVSWTGRIHTVAVLPPRPEVISQEQAEAFGLPACTFDKTLNFEPVPTDVEFGRRGELYVSSLPGGPEDGSLGARGGVFRVSPWNGSSKLIATGFLGATNLAVAPNGTVYVAELFGGRISRVAGGAAVPVAEVNEPAAVEWSKGGLLATADVQGSGKLVRISS